MSRQTVKQTYNPGDIEILITGRGDKTVRPRSFTPGLEQVTPAPPSVPAPSNKHFVFMILSSSRSGTSLHFINLRLRSTLDSAILTGSMLDLMLASRGPNCPLSFFSQPTTPCIAVVTPCVSSEVVSVSTREPPTLS